MRRTPRRSSTRSVRRPSSSGEGSARSPRSLPTASCWRCRAPKRAPASATISPDHARVARFGVEPLDFGGERGWIAGTGYTGEDGVELHIPIEAAEQCWELLLDAGITPAGLGARDTLRLEAGLPLHGHELGPGITPLQAGLGWVVRFDKDEFRGRQPLTEENARGVARRLRGLRLDGRQIPREGHAVLRAGTAIGAVTSGNFSPVLECGIALAFVPPDVLIGDTLAVDIRGREVPATVVRLPFVAPTEPRL